VLQWVFCARSLLDCGRCPVLQVLRRFESGRFATDSSLLMEEVAKASMAKGVAPPARGVSTSQPQRTHSRRVGMPAVTPAALAAVRGMVMVVAVVAAGIMAQAKPRQPLWAQLVPRGTQ
jgi:hypothetical protein